MKRVEVINHYTSSYLYINLRFFTLGFNPIFIFNLEKYFNLKHCDLHYYLLMVGFNLHTNSVLSFSVHFPHNCFQGPLQASSYNISKHRLYDNLNSENQFLGCLCCIWPFVIPILCFFTLLFLTIYSHYLKGYIVYIILKGIIKI